MKKKILLGVLIGVVATLSSTATYAISRTVELPWTNVIYNMSKEDEAISVFDDGDNKCYVARFDGQGSYGVSVAMSCVKQ
jgi:hypothetical protein